MFGELFKQVCCCSTYQFSKNRKRQESANVELDVVSTEINNIYTSGASVATTSDEAAASAAEFDCVFGIDPATVSWSTTVPFVPPITRGIVIKVYDGDTITVAAKLPYAGSLVYRFSVRMDGIDCPELRSKNESEQVCAQLAKEELSGIILGKTVELRDAKTEKYGRLLANVYMGELHLNKHMLDKRLAVAYDGGTKRSPDNWMDYHSGEWAFVESPKTGNVL